MTLSHLNEKWVHLMQKTIQIKIPAEVFWKYLAWEKRFELIPDINHIQRGDMIILEKWNAENNTYAGKRIRVIAKDVLRNCPGLLPGYCIISW